jgi:hypothetical protein
MNDEQERQLQALEDAIERAWEPCEAAGIDLFNTAPTTRAGVIAAIRYIQDQYRNDGEHMPRGRWLYEDEDDPRNGRDWLECFLDTLAEAVTDIGKREQS